MISMSNDTVYARQIFAGGRYGGGGTGSFPEQRLVIEPVVMDAPS